MVLTDTPCSKFPESLKGVVGMFTIVARYMHHPFLPLFLWPGKNQVFPILSAQFSVFLTLQNLLCLLYITGDNCSGVYLSNGQQLGHSYWRPLVRMQVDRQEVNNFGSSHDVAEGTQGCNLMNTKQAHTFNSVVQPLHTISPCSLCSHTKQLCCLAIFITAVLQPSTQGMLCFKSDSPGDSVGIWTTFALYHVKPSFVTAAVGYTKLKKLALCKQELQLFKEFLFSVNLLPFLKMETIIHLPSHILNHTSLIRIKFVSINKSIPSLKHPVRRWHLIEYASVL